MYFQPISLFKRMPKISLFIFFFLGFIQPVNAQETPNKADSIEYGYIEFDMNVDSALMILNNQFDNMLWVKNNEFIRVKAGLTSIKLSVIHDFLFEEQFDLKQNSKYTISHDFRTTPISKEVLNENYAARKILGYNLLVITDATTEITLNNETPGIEYLFANGEVGKNIIELKQASTFNSAFYTSTYEFENSDRRFQIVEKYISPKKSRARQLALVPGLSQTYKYEPIKALAIQIGFASTLVATSTFELRYRKNKRDFDDLLERYNESVSPISATALGNELEKTHDRLETDARIRNISLISLISIYAYNLFDAFFNEPKIGYRSEKPVEFFINSDSYTSLNGGVKINLSGR